MHWNEIADSFRFCRRYLENVTDKDIFAAGLSISSSFGNLADMNNIHPSISIRELLCPIFSNKSMTPYSALKYFHGIALDFQKKECVNATWADLMESKLRYKDGIFHWDEYKASN